MNKVSPKHRWHLTNIERKEIRRLTKQGVRQSVIARHLRLTAPTVSKAQRAMGLPTRRVVTPMLEETILELFQQGIGGYRIARHLRVPVSQVYRVAHENNFHRADRAGYPTPVENERRFIEAVKNREDYVIRLAKKYKIGIIKAGRLARQVLACTKFRPGAAKPPLSSNFPQKHFDHKMAKADELVQPPVSIEEATPEVPVAPILAPRESEPPAASVPEKMNLPILEMCVRIIESAIKALDDKMPDPLVLVTTLANMFAPENAAAAGFTVEPEVWKQSRANFIMGLTIGADCVARSRDALYRN